MPRLTPTFARFVVLPENRAALVAVQELAAAVAAGKVERSPQPLYIHGPAGSGKSHLASSFAHEVAKTRLDLAIARISAAELTTIEPAPAVQGNLFGQNTTAGDGLADPLAELRRSDILIFEDVQHLRPVMMEPCCQLIDDMLARRKPLLITGLVGPAQLEFRQQRFPARLRSRLAGGLVAGLQPLAAVSRKTLLGEMAQRRQLAVAPDILAWVANHVTGGARALEGAITTLCQLCRSLAGPLDVPTVATHFREQTEAAQLTIERIAMQVGGYFRVATSQLQSRSRLRGVLVPRQVGMFLARQLTNLSLGQIGAYFGGRDHTTVLHACQKVQTTLTRDPTLSGAIRQLQAALV